MKRSLWLVIMGFIVSLGLMAWVLARLDWRAFLTALTQVRLAWLAGAAGIIIASIMLRALRWNLISNVSTSQYGNFWRATNLGYLGNLIYPARAGEVLRMAAITQLAGLPAARAVTSAVVDRVADGLMLGLFMTLVLITQGPRGLGFWVPLSVVGAFVTVALGLAALSVMGEKWQARLTGWAGYLPPALTARLVSWYTQILEGLRSLKPGQLLTAGFSLSLLIFLLDYSAIYLVVLAFGWSLPFMAAMTVGVFLAVGSSLPSAPGYVGIYQVACVLALSFYGLNASMAVAYSLVLQFLIWMIIGAQGVLVALESGFRLLGGGKGQKIPAGKGTGLT